MLGRVLAAGLAVLFLLSLIPILQLAAYNRPCLDDYGFSLLTGRAWRDSASFWPVLSAAFRSVAKIYESWQGSFAAIFLFALQPGVFSERLYYMTTWILLSVYILANAFFFQTFLRRLLHFSIRDTVIVCVMAMTLGIQLMPNAAEGLYWYNGAMYYLFFYSLSLLLFALLCREYLSGGGKASLRRVCILLLAFTIGGGNLVTGLTVCVLLALFVCAAAIQKRFRPFYGAVLLCFAVGFAINILAPGNAVRQLSNPASPSAVKAIALALANAARFVIQWSSVWAIGGTALLLPVFWANADIERFRFRYPLLVTACSALLLGVSFTPPLYALNIIAGYRIFNAVFQEYIVLLLFNVFYYCGWAKRRRNERRTDPAASRSTARRNIAFGAAVLVCLLVLRVVSDRYPHYHKTAADFVSVSAARSVSSGEAAEYARQRDQRLEILNDAAVREVVFAPLTGIPALFMQEDLGETPDDWPNSDVARYYDKASIAVRMPQPGE